MLHKRKLEIHDFEAKRYFRRLEEFLGSREIDKRLKSIEQELRIERGVYLEYWVNQKNNWWLGLKKARELCRSQSAKSLKLDVLMAKPLETAIKLSCLYGTMSTSKRNEFRKRILTSDHLTPILFEIDVAAIFHQHGYTIKWADNVSGQRICEFTATTQEHEIEVECKTKTIDAGRMIIRPKFYRLVDDIAKLLISRGLFGTINIKVPLRIPTVLQSQKQIEKLLINSATEGLLFTNLSDGTEITTDLQKQNDIAFLEEDVASKVKSLHKPFAHIACYTSKRNQQLLNPIIVCVESKNPNKVLENVVEDLKDANKQISGNRCAIICCFIPEIEPESFDDLKSNSGIANMTKDFFMRYSKDCVYAVLYCSDTMQVSIGGQISTGIPGLSFINPNYNMRYKPYVPLS